MPWGSLERLGSVCTQNLPFWPLAFTGNVTLWKANPASREIAPFQGANGFFFFSLCLRVLHLHGHTDVMFVQSPRLMSNFQETVDLIGVH